MQTRMEMNYYITTQKSIKIIIELHSNNIIAYVQSNFIYDTGLQQKAISSVLIKFLSLRI